METVLKICASEWTNASRDKRELSLYREQGYDVAVLAKGEESDKGKIDEVEGYKVYRYNTRPLGSKVPNTINRIISVFTWSKYTRRLKPDIISGHDLVPALTIAWLSTIGIKKKPKIIYDSHEFEIERYGNHGKIKKKLIGKWEKFLISKSAFTIVVNDSIAEELVRIHKLSIPPIVIRSTPNYWHVEQEVCNRTRKKMEEKIGIPSITYLIMFHGNIGRGNGLENTIKALQGRKDVGLVLLGKKVDQQYFDSLIEMATAIGVRDRVMWHDAVPGDELWKYVGAVDIEIMAIEPIYKSYYYALPNKLFEAIQAETPIIASDLPEMKKIIEKYEIGKICRPDDWKNLQDCIDAMLSNKEEMERYKRNIKKAKKELCWEQEKKILSNAIRKYIE